MTSNNSTIKTSSRYESFNGLRAIAALGIAMMHYRAFIVVKPSVNFITENVIPFFTEFVFLFFMVSALGMCCGYYKKFEMFESSSGLKSSKFNTEDFYKKRFSRIWPYFALLVSIDLLMYVVQHGFTWNESLRAETYQALADLTLCFNFLPNPDITVIGGGWFLGTIFVFYIMFPFFVFLIGNKRRAWFAMAVALMMHLLTVHYFLTPEFCLESQIGNARHEITYSFIFLLAGGLLFLYKDKLTFSQNWQKGIALAVVVFGTMANVVWHPQILGENRLYLMLLFAAWIVYAMSGGFEVGLKGLKGPESSKGFKVLDNKVMKFLGDISMEIYLTHMMMFRLVEKIHLERHIGDNDWLFVATYVVGISLTIAFAWTVKNKVFSVVGNVLAKVTKH